MNKLTALSPVKLQLPESGDLPRELIARMGPESLSDSQLLSVMIGSGIRNQHVGRIAEEVLKVFDRKNGCTSLKDLLSIKGMGMAKAAMISAALEFSRRRLCPDSGKITFPADVMSFIRHYTDRKQEHFISLSLNGAHEVIAVRVVSVGLVNRTVVVFMLSSTHIEKNIRMRILL